MFDKFPTQVSSLDQLLSLNVTSLLHIQVQCWWPGFWAPSVSTDMRCLSNMHCTHCTSVLSSSESPAHLPIRFQGPEASLTGVLQQVHCSHGGAVLVTQHPDRVARI